METLLIRLYSNPVIDDHTSRKLWIPKKAEVAQAMRFCMGGKIHTTSMFADH
jgi:hypothetical protein